MKTLTCAAVVVVCLVLVPLQGFAADPCCFENPRYTGVCTVTPDEDETCSSILGYLNNQASVGKSYCGNTTIRGGWASTDCDAEEHRLAAIFQPEEATTSEPTPLTE